MSAFICENKKFSNVGNFILLNNRTSMDRFLKEFDGETAAQKVESFLKRLLILNVKSVNHRYDGSHEEPAVYLNDFHFERSASHIKWIEFVKTLDCISYQCSELPGWYETAEYATIRSLKEAALQSSYEYQESEGW